MTNMARQAVSKRLYCKRCMYANQSGKPQLQSLLIASLSTLKKIGTRKETTGEDHRYVRTIIYHRTHGGMLFGVFAGYERGTHQLTVSDDDDAEMLNVEQVAPPKTQANKRREF